jgi:hypothetical protein
MSAYITRLIGTDELVGFFVADSAKDLFWSIDEVINPFSCEYKRVTHGGIFWYKGGDVYDEENGDEGRDTLDLDGASMSERVLLDYEDNRKWKHFDYSDDSYYK